MFWGVRNEEDKQIRLSYYAIASRNHGADSHSIYDIQLFIDAY